ncbi:MAG: hypothetical protein AAF702_32800 [Chloroflexota bacterium]
MQMTELVRKVGPVDVKLIRRDSFLLFMLAFAVIIAVVLRSLLPWLNDMLAQNEVLPGERFPVYLESFYPLIVGYMTFFTGSLLVGTIFGFVLLDEKDDNTLTAMMVTPIPLSQYALYRVGVPALLAFFIIMGMMLAVSQVVPPIWQLLLLAAGGALTAPIISLFFAIVAENKVQGFAYSKFGGIAGWTILIGWFVREPWQWLIGFFPPFWINKAYWLALEGRSIWWAALAIGVLLQLLLIRWMLNRFSQVAYRT